MQITSQQIKLARIWLGLTQVKLAKALDLHPKSIKHMEQGARPCRGPVAVLINMLCSQPGVGVKSAKPRYADLAPGDWTACAKYHTVELKYDGHYRELRGGPGGWELLSRSGAVIDTGSEPLPRCRILCEHITGTEWSNASPLRDKLIAWSAVDTNAEHVTRAQLEVLVGAINDAGVGLLLSEQHPAADAENMWADAVVGSGWEGLVLRTKSGDYARMKQRASLDYVVTSYDGASITGGLYNGRGQLIDKVHVPHTGPVELGAVFEASGLGITARRSLKNPRFDRWRPEKPARECR